MTKPVKTLQRPNNNHQAIRRSVLATVNASKNRLTPRELEKSLYEEFPSDKNTIKSVVKDLVLEQELVYTYQFGCSFLEKSYTVSCTILCISFNSKSILCSSSATGIERNNN